MELFRPFSPLQASRNFPLHHSGLPLLLGLSDFDLGFVVLLFCSSFFSVPHPDSQSSHLLPLLSPDRFVLRREVGPTAEAWSTDSSLGKEEY